MTSPQLVARYLEPRIREALADTPVVLLHGPRQAGKTTLAQRVAGAKRRYLTLDDAATLCQRARTRRASCAVWTSR